MRRPVVIALSVALMVLLATVGIASAQDGDPAVPPLDETLADDTYADVITVTKPTEYEVIAINDGGYQNNYPLTWTRVDGAILYHIRIYIAPVVKKDSDLVLYEARVLDYIYTPSESEDYQLRDPEFLLDVGQLPPGVWSQVVVTAFGPTDRFLQEYPDFRSQPTDLGLESGYYARLTNPSRPRSFFIAVATGDQPIPATPNESDFPTYDEIITQEPNPEPLPLLEVTTTPSNTLWDLINRIRFGGNN